MLFALGFDKFIFGQTPGATSIIGSTLILGSAIYMAMQRDGSTKGNNEEASPGHNRDEEEGLMAAIEGEGGEAEGGGEIQMQTVQARRGQSTVEQE